MSVHDATDDHDLPWQDFAAFFRARDDDDRGFLVELDHAADRRRSWTVGQWRDEVLGTAAWLADQGVVRGQTVATLAGNSADALAVAYACWYIGACCVPLNPHDSAERNEFVLRDCGTRLLVTRGDEDTLAAASAIRAADVTARTTDVTTPPACAGTLDIAALCVYTSGTTGDPKAVVLTARNLLTTVDGMVVGFDWPADTRVLTVLPVHHVNGLLVSSLLPWYQRLSTVLCDRFRADRFWADAAAEGATVCSVVPTLLEFLLLADDGPAPTLREFVCGAGPLLPDTVVEFEARFATPVRHLYGLSETTAAVTVTPRMPADRRTHWHTAYGMPSIGTVVPHAQVDVLDPEGLRAGPEERGEIVVRGAVVMTGYAGREAATAEAFRGGWFHSGDEGFWVPDDDGTPFLFVSGRIKELIIRGGVNISPVQVDAVIRKHPAVEFGLAVPFANRFFGEEIAAYVVTTQPVTDDELLRFWAGRSSWSRSPKVVVRGVDVPYTATGKAKRIELARTLAPQLMKYRDERFPRR